MATVLTVNLVMFVVEVVGGLLTDSLALLADAGHLLSDVGAILVGLFAASVATRVAKANYTFGYRRTEILAALINGLTLAAISVLIIYGAVRRLGSEHTVEGAAVVGLGVFGLIGNVWSVGILARGERSDLNLEGVLRHMFADAAGSVAVIVSGTVILLTGWSPIDPILSIFIALLILMSSWKLIVDPVRVLLESAPSGIDVESVATKICSQQFVIEVHDLHIWTVTSGFPTLSAHIVVNRSCDRDLVRNQVEALLAEEFSIRHTTLQLVYPEEQGLITVKPAK